LQIAKLKASERRVRLELEQEIAERMKLFRSLVGNAVAPDVMDSMGDMRLQIVDFKAQRDSLAAELKLVEAAVADFELFISGERMALEGSPSERLKACLRRI
jgi:hypothetical protein